MRHMLVPLFTLVLSRGLRRDGTTRLSIPDDYGVLVMAHGGRAEWDRSVLAAVEPLRESSHIVAPRLV